MQCVDEMNGEEDQGNVAPMPCSANDFRRLLKERTLVADDLPFPFRGERAALSCRPRRESSFPTGGA